MDHDAVPEERWHGETADVWRERWGVPILSIFRRVGSTNDVATRLAGEGAPQGTVVLADEQTRGRGQRGRGWVAGPGQSVLLSVVLRHGGRGPRGPLPLRLGLATARAIEDVAPVRVGLKWPNDLFIGARKTGGLLCEATVEGTRLLHMVVGVGINVRQRDEDWPDPLRGHATSLEAEAGAAVSRPELVGRILTGIRAAAGPLRPLGPDELDALRQRDILRGQPVTVDGAPAGIAAGIAPDGALLVRQADRERRFVTGTVRLVGGALPGRTRGKEHAP